MQLFASTIANHLRRTLYYSSLDSMHTYVSSNCSYSSYPPFYMAFVDTKHYVVLHFKKVNMSIPAPPIDGWWLRKSSSRDKNVWLQSLENDLKFFQKLMPSATDWARIGTKHRAYRRVKIMDPAPIGAGWVLTTNRRDGHIEDFALEVLDGLIKVGP
ncbi:hypothetical protein PPACK8108_LOCUS22275 [Phakopsora pachyrhizi]|uniref:Uncharacterized protein n=1 Tax=Phakopsora pachyrhizi TaxID=170000 RepID=A0AAV0BJT5_PHAPC|nr:hypothetical protein PPACK8108_LOCUS22275 [Phakopsora pachyrhizi]